MGDPDEFIFGHVVAKYSPLPGPGGCPLPGMVVGVVGGRDTTPQKDGTRCLYARIYNSDPIAQEADGDVFEIRERGGIWVNWGVPKAQSQSDYSTFKITKQELDWMWRAAQAFPFHTPDKVGPPPARLIPMNVKS